MNINLFLSSEITGEMINSISWLRDVPFGNPDNSDVSDKKTDIERVMNKHREGKGLYPKTNEHTLGSEYIVQVFKNASVVFGC